MKGMFVDSGLYYNILEVIQMLDKVLTLSSISTKSWMFGSKNQWKNEMGYGKLLNALLEQSIYFLLHSLSIPTYLCTVDKLYFRYLTHITFSAAHL